MFITASSCSCRKWIDDHINSKKYSPNCKTGDCVELNSKVSLFVKPTGEALSNVSVEVLFHNRSNWVVALSAPHRVASGKTDKNGEYKFKEKIDITDFKDYSLIVIIPEQKNYLIVNSTVNAGSISKIFNSYNEDALKNINFEFYKKTNLSININRTQMDDCKYFTVYYSFENSPAHSIYQKTGDQSAIDVIKQIDVPVDLYVKIWWQKNIGDERYIYRDSIVCKPNIINEFNIYY